MAFVDGIVVDDLAVAYWPQAGDAAEGVFPAPRLPGFPSRAELAEAYAAETGRDLTALPFRHALGLWKIAIICEACSAGRSTTRATPLDWHSRPAHRRGPRHTAAARRLSGGTVIDAMRSRERLEEAATEIAAAGGSAIVTPTDLRELMAARVSRSSAQSSRVVIKSRR
jgi:hypothetical protein